MSSKDARERLELYLALEFRQESYEDLRPLILLLEGIFEDFEKEHDPEALLAITSFASEEERIASIRQPALLALTPIAQTLKYLSHQKAVPKDVYDALRARQKFLNNIVGSVTVDPSGNVFELVHHDRG
ncbi:MAG: hypothetical protein AB199_01580 [Parcubacteria bacterium C7867-004]|nr:MAG: hypothetical protein AB199_01580 [Parcubacteria bacterium C7867-004]